MAKRSETEKSEKIKRWEPPETFSLGGRTWRVIIKDLEDSHGMTLSEEERNTVGLCRNYEQEIVIVRNSNPNIFMMTFYHELAHAIMYTLGRSKLNRDEGFIDALASMIVQFELSKK